MVRYKGHAPVPSPSWYLYTTDASSVRLLTDDGAPSPELNTDPARTPAELTAAIHARRAAWASTSCGTSNRPSRCSAGDAEPCGVQPGQGWP